MGVGGQRHAPAVLLPGKTRYPLYRRLGVPHGRAGWVWKVSRPPGFGPRTVQPVAGRYTDCAITALILVRNGINSFEKSISSEAPTQSVSTYTYVYTYLVI
jgi:hypothetical protein